MVTKQFPETPRVPKVRTRAVMTASCPEPPAAPTTAAFHGFFGANWHPISGAFLNAPDRLIVSNAAVVVA
jgi:hypothetical protein